MDDRRPLLMFEHTTEKAEYLHSRHARSNQSIDILEEWISLCRTYVISLTINMCQSNLVRYKKLGQLLTLLRNHLN